MIAHLKGLLVSTGIDQAVIDVGGVGYAVGLSARSLTALGRPGDSVIVHTELLVGEDFMRLVGFASETERDWFRLLTSVQGVGARVALAILSALEPGELGRAVAAQDKATVTRANGVGPKLAERIVRELKDKVGTIPSGPLPTGGSGTAVPDDSAQGDALAALASLGFKPAEASLAVGAALDELGMDASLDALVRLALRKAAK